MAAGNGDPRNLAKFAESVGAGKRWADDSERLADGALSALGAAARTPLHQREQRHEHLVAAEVCATLALRDKVDELVQVLRLGIEQQAERF